MIPRVVFSIRVFTREYRENTRSSVSDFADVFSLSSSSSSIGSLLAASRYTRKKGASSHTKLSSRTTNKYNIVCGTLSICGQSATRHHHIRTASNWLLLNASDGIIIYRKSKYKYRGGVISY